MWSIILQHPLALVRSEGDGDIVVGDFFAVEKRAIGYLRVIPFPFDSMGHIDIPCFRIPFYAERQGDILILCPVKFSECQIGFKKEYFVVLILLCNFALSKQNIVPSFPVAVSVNNQLIFRARILLSAKFISKAMAAHQSGLFHIFIIPQMDNKLSAVPRSIDISRDQSLIMRGMAIVLIALHNYCHWMSFIVDENESSFSEDLTLRFFDQVTDISDRWIYNVFSFLGWYGVPVFIFLTAFGLVRKYEGEKSTAMNKPTFLYDNWLKLLALLLPGVACYVILDIGHFITSGNGGWLSNKIPTHLLNLTFLNDILGLWVNTDPGVYWYFGLTLEFYFLYAFAVYRRPVSILVWLTLASIALQAAAHAGLFGDHEKMLWWVRQNITGWMTPFAFGIIYARTKAISPVWIYVTIIAAAIMFFPVMIDQSSWQLSLLCAIVLATAVARISLRIPYWRSFWIYIGRLSPFIFAAHPIVRSVMFQHLSLREKPDAIAFISYILLVMILSILYKAAWKHTTPALKSRIDKALSTCRHLKKK